MGLLWQTAQGLQRVGTAAALTPAGQAVVSQIASHERDAYWLAAGWVALGAGLMSWFGDDEPAKPHPDVDLPASGAWHPVELIHCTAHPYWDCYTSGEGCLGRSV